MPSVTIQTNLGINTSNNRKSNRLWNQRQAHHKTGQHIATNIRKPLLLNGLPHKQTCKPILLRHHLLPRSQSINKKKERVALCLGTPNARRHTKPAR